MDNRLLSASDYNLLRSSNVIKLEEKFERFRTALPFLKTTEYQQGNHVCLLYDDDASMKTFCKEYISSGLKNGERVICLFDRMNYERILEILDLQGLDYFSQVVGNLIVKSCENSIMMGDEKKPKSIAALYAEIVGPYNRKETKKTRIITEMSVFLRNFPDSNELLELEAHINENLDDDVKLLCLYNSKSFDPRFLISVLQTHPFCAFENAIFKNVNYIPPQQYLSKDKDRVFLNAIMECMKKGRDLEQDIRDKSLLIEELMNLEKKLIQKNKELDEFTSIVSHELKSPLNLIKAYLDEIKDPELFGYYAERLAVKVNDSIHMVDNLLKLSRAGLIIREKQRVELDLTIRSVFYCLKPSDVNARLTIAPNFPGVVGDVSRLEQVFTNLISNSIQHRDPDKHELEIEVKYKIRNDEIIILYKDNGLGIKKEVLGRLFEPGYTTRDNGNGFGLVIVRKIIEAHGGVIKANSLGERMGASFIIRIPMGMK
ncbi:MAG: MEDS domain-containing protein [Firmicutes bacterium]|nr:MEDS domain-containing protein [Bacillota bacterium]